MPLFFILCLIISWAVWIPEAVATLSNHEAALAGGGLLDALAVWGPGLSAILLSFLIAGKIGLQELFRPIHRWRVGIHWYFLVLFYPTAIWLMARAIDTILGQSYELLFMPILNCLNLPPLS